VELLACAQLFDQQAGNLLLIRSLDLRGVWHVEVIRSVIQDVNVVKLTGDLDGSNAPNVQAQIMPLAIANVKMILDMSEVSYMSSAGLRMLLVMYRTINSKSGKVVLVGLSEDIRDTMSMTGFLDFFTYLETLDDGLKNLSS
jgi:anti-sigma B factor antagonist